MEQAGDGVAAKARKPPLCYQRQYQAMRALEQLGQLEVDARKVVYVEEAAIVDFVGGDAPIGDAIGLRLEQRMQPAPALHLARIAVEAFRRLFERRLDRGLARRQPGQRRLELHALGMDARAALARTRLAQPRGRVG